MVEKEIVELLDKLLSVRSVTKKKSREVIQVVANYLTEKCIQFDTHVYRDDEGVDFHNLVAYRDVGAANTINLLCHLDVIDVDNPEQWNIFRKDGCLFGRGTADAKGGVAAAIVAFQNARAKEIDHNLRLILTTDEEIGDIHGAKRIYENLKSKKDDLTIAIEPFGDNVVYKHFGILRFGVEFKNPTSHTKTRGLNVNDNYAYFRVAAGEFLKKIDAKFEVNSVEENNGSILSTTYIAGKDGKCVGDLSNLGQNPSYANIKFDVRTIPSANISEIYQGLEELAYSREGVKLCTYIAEGPPLNTSVDNKYVQTLIGLGKELLVETCSTDAKWAKDHAAIVFGPVGDDIHGSNEKVNIKSLKRFYDTLIKIF